MLALIHPHMAAFCAIFAQEHTDDPDDLPTTATLPERARESSHDLSTQTDKEGQDMARRMLVPIAVLLAVSMLVVPNSVSAQVVPEKPSDLVTLQPLGFCPMGGFDMRNRVLPEGTDAPFSIPSGRVLVITDWQWGDINTQRTNSWEVAALSLQTDTRVLAVGIAGNSTPGAQGTTPFTQTTSTSASIVGMVVVKPGVHVCISTQTRGFPNFAVVHGFLATDE
jgi:hypothetical protein